MCIFAPMKNNFNLQQYNSFGFNTVAKYFVEINDIQQLELLITSDAFKQEKHLVLSGGNNVLFQDDFRICWTLNFSKSITYKKR